jgi:hypothetical protein
VLSQNFRNLYHHTVLLLMYCSLLLIDRNQDIFQLQLCFIRPCRCSRSRRIASGYRCLRIGLRRRRNLLRKVRSQNVGCLGGCLMASNVRVLMDSSQVTHGSGGQAAADTVFSSHPVYCARHQIA